MAAIQKMTRLILQYCSGLIFAWGVGFFVGTVGGLCLMWYCKVFLPPPPSPHAYDDWIGGMSCFIGLFGGIPFGASLGVFLVDKLFFKSASHYVWRIIVSFVMGILGALFVGWGLPFLGIPNDGWFEPSQLSDIYDIYLWLSCGGGDSFLLTSVLFSLIGYNAVGLFKYKKVKPSVCN